MPESALSVRNRDLLIYVLIGALSAVICIGDVLTPLGVAEWLFYMIPVLLCMFQSRPLAAYLVVALEGVLIVLGLFLSPPGVAFGLSATNRAMFVVIAFGMAFMIERALADRLRARNLLWLEQGRTCIAASVIGEQELAVLGERALRELAHYLGAQVALLYRLDHGMLTPLAAFGAAPLPQAGIAVGQGLAGEVARQGKLMALDDVPDDYLRVSSALGHSTPRHVVIAPVTADRQVVGVLEFGFLHRPGNSAAQAQLLGLAAEKIGIAMRSALHRQRLQELLDETQRQSAALEAQQEELRVTNEELHEQTHSLLESQSLLETQQKELELSNAQLEDRTQSLERQKAELLQVQRQLQANAAELERASRYKSEFLANMSHELRTPLNSSLILAQMLAMNRSGTLTEEQVGYAKTIQAANTDLLNLINDILDLSKIEAGHATAEPAPVKLDGLLTSVRRMFEPVAAQKGVAFKVVNISESLDEIVTDERWLSQILKNLLSNAFKFTDSGEVTLEISTAPDDRLCFAVSDTGIGIAAHQQQVIFEAFRQADGSINRAYGGTGLGLSISRELAHLLGGDIALESTPGAGSTFTLVIPRHLAPADVPQRSQAGADHAATVAAATPGARFEDSAANLMVAAALAAPAQQAPAAAPAQPAAELERKHARLILIVEDDPKFAGVLCDLVHELRFDCVHAANGSDAVKLARQHHPDAILLDVRLPDYSGLSVLERMKRDPATRHIPVHMLSVDDYKQAALELGAVGYALKPVARDEVMRAIEKLEKKLAHDVSRILIVEDNAALRESLARMLGEDRRTEIVSAGTAAEALAHLADATFDCMVMDLMLPDASGYDILEQMARGGKYAFPPVIVYTGRALSRDEEQRLRRYSQSIIIKGAKSPERLLDEVSLFLHRVETSLPPEQQQALKQVRQRDAAFEGRRILVAEDDVRNVFALTSVFEPLGAELIVTRNGREALQQLAERADIELVLMDLMMPEMDGLTAMREIRKQPQHRNLPIIALTAKAMAHDRQDCLNAGANDYIAKPIDVDQLVSLCRVWLPK